MKKIIYLLAISLLTMAACQDINQDHGQLFSSDDLENQEFYITSDADTTLTGKNGTVLTIEKESFVDQTGNPVTGKIKISFKECLSKLDMILGNMTTTSNGEPLESGGMIYVNATSNKEQLMIADSKSIGVSVPAQTVMENMQLFEGVKTENGIDWQNPVALKKVVQKEPQIEQDIIEQEVIIKRTNVGYYVKGYSYSGNFPNHKFNRKFDTIPAQLSSKIGQVCWGGEGIILTKDSVIQIDSFEVALIKMDSIREVRWVNFSSNGPAVLGQNTFREDQETNYIFSTNKLGWANIDRFFNDPRTKEIDLIVTVKQQDEYDNVYTSMIFKNQNMYLPGYQKKDNSYSFTHGDYEKTALPVGETTTILITAYKDDKPFYSIKTFTIQEEQTIDLELSATTKESLKIELKNNI